MIMEETKIILEKLINESKSKNLVFKRNLLKEYFQIITLDFIYSTKKWNDLILFGGASLSHCYGLPRLSEDLDFISLKKDLEIEKLAIDLKNYYENKGIEIKTKVQKFRIYLKFPILRELKLAKRDESDLLFLKIEIDTNFEFCKDFKIEFVPIFKFNKPILIKTFDLETLFSTKLRAIILRKWEKTTKSGELIAKIKGRDYFDLIWYLEKGVKPNLNCLGIKEAKNLEDLKKKLFDIVKIIDLKSIKNDLEPLIEDINYVNNLSKNIKDIIIKSLSKL